MIPIKDIYIYIYTLSSNNNDDNNTVPVDHKIRFKEIETRDKY